MKLKASFWLVLMTIGIFIGLVLPLVNAETFDIGTKVSESDLDLREKKLVYFDSGSTVYVEADYIDYMSSIFDGDESTGINHYFGPGHDVMQIELMFPSALYVNSITIKPIFGGGISNYSFEIDTPLTFGPSFAYDTSTQESFQINCKITGIVLVLYSGGTNHFYFNDVIIDYTPAELPEDLENGNEHDDEDDLDIDDLFFEFPFIGLLWIIVIIALISCMRRRRANKKEKKDVEPESTEEQLPSPESDEPQSSEKEEEVGGRFCPNCGKFTEVKGPFCPHCKLSMI